MEYDGEIIYADKREAAEISIEFFNRGVLFWTFWPGLPGVNMGDFLATVNDLNYNASASRYYINDNDDLVVEMWLPEYYDRMLFAEAVAIWENESYALLLEHPILDYLK